VRSLLAESNKRLAPLSDPLITDFGLHRWLAQDREEAYSDWLQWVLQQVQAPSQIFRLLGVDSPAGLPEWRTGPPVIEREWHVPEGHDGQAGRLDLLVRYEGKALFVLEVKKTDADQADTAKQAGYKLWLDARPEPHRYAILIAVDADEEEYEGFRELPWSALCIGLRRLARYHCREGKLVIGAQCLALCGAVEQNLLGFSAGAAADKPAASSDRLVTHLQRWLSENADDDAP
jgi:hypothetical protein